MTSITLNTLEAEIAPAARKRTAGTTAERRIMVASDVSVALVVAWLTHPVPAVLATVVAAAVWQAKGLYSRRFALSALDDLAALSFGAVCAFAAGAVVGSQLLGLGTTAAFGVVLSLFVAVVIGRAAVYWIIRRARVTGSISYPTVLVGAGAVAVGLARRIREHPESGLRPVGFLDAQAACDELPVPLLGSARELPRVIADHEITDVVVGYGGLSPAELVEILRTCDRLAVEIHVLPRLYEMHRLSAGSDHVWGIPLVRIGRRAHRSLSWRVKRLMDVLVAGMVLLLASPVLAVTALAVRLELGPGIIFRQTRIGLDGRTFELLKFRSMKPVPTGQESPWSVGGGDRVGTVGRFIRRYSLDELPQLVNVLLGDMSLVGPRPERPQYVEQFVRQVPGYGDRHRVPVGLTGLAAVHGLRGDTSIADRAYFDNVYIENWSMWLDLKILSRTVLCVLRGTGG